MVNALYIMKNKQMSYMKTEPNEILCLGKPLVLILVRWCSDRVSSASLGNHPSSLITPSWTRQSSRSKTSSHDKHEISLAAATSTSTQLRARRFSDVKPCRDMQPDSRGLVNIWAGDDRQSSWMWVRCLMRLDRASFTFTPQRASTVRFGRVLLNCSINGSKQ